MQYKDLNGHQRAEVMANYREGVLATITEQHVEEWFDNLHPQDLLDWQEYFAATPGCEQNENASANTSAQLSNDRRAMAKRLTDSFYSCNSRTPRYL